MARRTAFGNSKRGSAPVSGWWLRFLVLPLLFCLTALGQSDLEGRRIGKVDIDFGQGQGQTNAALSEQYQLTARTALDDVYSASRVRDAIQALYDTRGVETVDVRATPDPSGTVSLVFAIKRKMQAQKVSIKIIDGT